MENSKYPVFIFILTSLLFSGLFFLNNRSIGIVISDNCEKVRVFSHGGGYIACLEYLESIPNKANGWCQSRLDNMIQTNKEYQKYKATDCRLKAITSSDAPGGGIGCYEFCEFVCCE